MSAVTHDKLDDVDDVRYCTGGCEQWFAPALAPHPGTSHGLPLTPVPNPYVCLSCRSKKGIPR